jgi:hypothetical protein
MRFVAGKQFHFFITEPETKAANPPPPHLNTDTAHASTRRQTHIASSKIALLSEHKDINIGHDTEQFPSISHPHKVR